MSTFIQKIIVAFLLFATGTISAQNGEYWVFFTDKNDTEFNPYTYFDAKAIERRLKNNLPLNHSSDYPLNNQYKGEVSQIATTVTGESRWFNALAVIATQSELHVIEALPFVKNTKLITSQSNLATYKDDFDLNNKEQFILNKQTQGMQGKLFTQSGYTGKGIRIAIFDGGFPAVDYSPVFEHVRNENRIIATYDFVKEKEFVYDFSKHGTACMSCICGTVNDLMIGLATDAEFLLARTEKNTEPFSEEVNWMQAMEWADKNGAQIISSSLGYTENRYFIHDMDGKQALVTRAANMAAAKGILVINAMGNEGTDKWKYMGAPADADSIISVGGLDPFTDYHINFSSFGPTADKRLKPNVCGYGYAITLGKNGLSGSYGTSFSTPLVAGFIACAWQSNPELTNMELMKEIEKSGHLYPYFDYAHGYGLPQASYFINKKTHTTPTFEISENENEIIISNIETNHVSTKVGSNKLYYHIRNADGTIAQYAILEPYQKEMLKIDKSKMDENKTLMLYFNDYTEEYQLKKSL